MVGRGSRHHTPHDRDHTIGTTFTPALATITVTHLIITSRTIAVPPSKTYRSFSSCLVSLLSVPGLLGPVTQVFAQGKGIKTKELSPIDGSGNNLNKVIRHNVAYQRVNKSIVKNEKVPHIELDSTSRQCNTTTVPTRQLNESIPTSRSR